MNGPPQDEFLVKLQHDRYMMPLNTTRYLNDLRCVLWEMVEKRGFDAVFAKNEKLPEAALRTLKKDFSFKDRDSLRDYLRLEYDKKVKDYASIRDW